MCIQVIVLIAARKWTVIQMADVEKVKSMSRAERSALYLKYDNLFNEIERLYSKSSGEVHKAYSKVLDIIFDMAIDVEVKRHAHWIEDKYGSVFECSECGYSTDYRLTNYCPDCGALMDGKENENDPR